MFPEVETMKSRNKIEPRFSKFQIKFVLISGRLVGVELRSFLSIRHIAPLSNPMS